MIDLFLKFADSETAANVFAAIGLQLESGKQEFGDSYIDLDILFGDGIVRFQNGTALNEFGMEYPTYSEVDGFHVNVRYQGESAPEVLNEYRIFPEYPKCVFA